ncbi:hypothetical protein [uncultured Desulfuromonas sp.]|uniref:hypothetical protein n=1 Tax=uncultured Desulfuromonas sp. TaxID=181013 RepID=UPI002AABB82E|nr:hypothetical protein [uncultured Desulfuromonas sp.]
MNSSVSALLDMGQLCAIVYKDFGTGLYLDKNRILTGTFYMDSDQFTLNSSYTIVDYISTDNDMQALLLQVSGTDEYVIVFRGTQEPLDILEDAIIGLHNYNLQFQDALAYVQSVLADPRYNITTDNLTLAGHSLGGILTQAVGAVLEIESYAFNPYGTERLLTMPINDDIGLIDALTSLGIYAVLDAFGLDSSYAESARENVLNISYSDFGALNGDILSNLATELASEHLGLFLPIFGEDVGLDGHKMSVLNAALQHYADILSHFVDTTTLSDLSIVYALNGEDGYTRTESTFSALNITSTADQSLTLNIFATTNTEGDVVSLSPDDIYYLAGTDIAYRYALVSLNPFAITGDDAIYVDYNQNGELDICNRTTGEGQLSTMYLQDRAEMLANLLYANINDSTESDSAVIYEDVALKITLNDPELLDVPNPSPDYTIAFGGDDNETITGTSSLWAGDHKPPLQHGR